MCIENPFVAYKKVMNKKGNKEAYLNLFNESVE
jgi:hypothetical protein